MAKKNNLEKGLTLVEMLVAMFIFSLVFGASSALFISAIQNQRRALATQQLLNQTSYIVEYIGRAMRMATKDDIAGGSCLSQNKANFEVSALGTGGIRFKNYLGQCQEFYRDVSGRLVEKKGPIGSETENYLTSPNLYVESFNIGQSGWSQNDLFQPRVTFSLEIRKAGAGNQPKIKIQTTVSQRRLDFSE